VKIFRHIYTERASGAEWSVVQAATLLTDAKKRECSTLIIYSALELRMAIEQLLFSIIVMAGDLDSDTFTECRRKDGLFRVLERVSPKYSMMCRFCRVMASFYPEVPEIAEWDVRSLKRFYTQLSDLCHSQLLIEGMHEAPQKWDSKVSLLEKGYDFLSSGMTKNTAVLKFDEASPSVVALWDEYEKGKITIDDVRERFALVKPVLDQQRIHK
jgi:hypothetical protein